MKAAQERHKALDSIHLCREMSVIGTEWCEMGMKKLLE